MKRMIATIGLIATFSALPISAATLFENGGPAVVSGNCRFECTNDIGAENFTLSAGATVELVTFTTLYRKTLDGSGVTVDWSLRNDSSSLPGSIIASGSGITPTLQNLGTVSDTYDEVVFSLDIADTYLSAGDYWLTLQLVAPNALGPAYYWMSADDGDALSAYSVNGGVSWITPYPVGSNGAQFSMEGTSVPIPAAAWLFGSALVGLVAIKRKHS